MPLVSRTRATLRSAELGFFGVWVKTRTQTPRFCGLSCSAGLLVFVSTLSRPCRTNWLIVGTSTPHTRIPAHDPTRDCESVETSSTGHRPDDVRGSRPRDRESGPAPG